MSEERGSFRLVATLTAAGLLSGLAIVGSYRATLPAITAHRREVLERAVLEVLPGAARMERLAWQEGALHPTTEDGPEVVFAGYDAAGAPVGFALPGEGPGFQDTIGLLVGYRPEGHRIVGLAVLESRETPGLGDRIYKDPSFLASFHDLAADPRVELVKDGADAENEVDALTGATISSSAVVRIVNATVAAWRDRLPGAPAEEEGG